VVGGGVPSSLSSLFRLRGRFTSHHDHVYRGPPLRSRKVDSGFRLGFPREAFPRRAKLKCSLAFTPTHSGLPLDSSLKSMAPPAFAVDHTRTAKCPELLCLAQALLMPDMPGWCPAPPRRALPLLPRSYELMRQTSSLLRTS